MKQELLLSRIYIYVGLFIFIIVHISYSIYSQKILFEIPFLAVTILLCIRSKWSLEEKKIRNVVIAVLLILFFNYFLRMGYLGMGTIVLLLLCIFQYMFSMKIVLSSTDYKRIMVLLFLMLFIYLFINKDEYNPNTVSYIWGALGCFITILVNRKKHIIPLLLFFIFIEMQIYEYGSRTTMLSFLLFCVLGFIPIKLLRNRIFFRLLLYFVVLGGLVYVFTYTYIFVENVDVTSFENTEYSNKGFFTGRQYIWIEVLKLLSEHPLTGIGNKIELESFETVNLHNSMLNFIALYGAVIAFCVVYIMIKVIDVLRPYLEIKKVKSSFAAIVFFLIVSFSETNLVYESFSVMFPLCIAYSEINKVRARGKIYKE